MIYGKYLDFICGNGCGFQSQVFTVGPPEELITIGWTGGKHYKEYRTLYPLSHMCKRRWAGTEYPALVTGDVVVVFPTRSPFYVFTMMVAPMSLLIWL